MRLVVHGDDFTFLGGNSQLKWAQKMMADEYSVKVRGILGQEKSDDNTHPHLKQVP